MSVDWRRDRRGQGADRRGRALPPPPARPAPRPCTSGIL